MWCHLICFYFKLWSLILIQIFKWVCTRLATSLLRGGPLFMKRTCVENHDFTKNFNFAFMSLNLILRNFLAIFSPSEWISSVWVGIVMPLVIFLKLNNQQQSSNRRLLRMHQVISGLIILLSVVWIIYVYISPVWDMDYLDFVMKFKIN